ncbi:MAG TPA: T9SS type A sorting domain-containing protein [Cytophagaceae bacterium]
MKRKLLLSNLTLLINLSIFHFSTNAQNALFTDHGFIPMSQVTASVDFQTAIYIDPYVFVATDDGIWKNNLNTREWTAAGLQGKSIKCLYKHPTLANKLFAGAYITEDPNYPRPNRIPLYLSNDGGASWNPATNPLNKNYNCFAARPNHPDHIYANVDATNIGFSTDGNNWVLINNINGGDVGSTSPILFTAGNSNHLYIGSETPLDDAWLGRYRIDNSNPILLSDFNKVVRGGSGPWSNRRPNRLQTYPFTPNTIYAGLEGALAKVKDTVMTFIYKANSGDATKPYVYIKSIWVDPSDTNHIIFGGFAKNEASSGVYQMSLMETYNEGATFHRYTNNFNVADPWICDMVDLGDEKIGIIISDMTTGNRKVKLLIMQPQVITSKERAFSNDQISISPIPSNDVIRLEYRSIESTSFELKLYNSFGHEVYQSLSETEIKAIDISPLDNGVYYLHLNIDGKVLVKKISKI